MTILFARAFRLLLSAASCTGLLALCACGDDSPAETGDGSVPITQTDGAVLDANMPGLSSEAGAMDGGARADAGSVTPVMLYGGKLGRKHVYIVHSDGGRGCLADDAGTTTAEIIREYDAGGMQGFDVLGPCAPQESKVRVRDTDMEQLNAEVWHSLLKAPVVTGAMWDSLPPYRFEWRFLGSVTVAAGTFRDCWLRKSLNTALLDTVYCPGIGRVSMTSATYSIELKSVTP
jgi:hypothetical protein